MIIPAIGLTDEIALQKAVALILCADARLANVPIVPEIKFLQESELALNCIWTMPRSSFQITAQGWNVLPAALQGDLVGGGILVEQPEMDSNSPGVSGPTATWRVPIVGFVEPNTAFVPGVGIGFTSSQLCQIALDIFQNLFSYQYGTFQIEQQAIKAANDRQTENPNIAAHRVIVKATVGRVQSTRSANVTATFAAGQCTLTCADNAASIYWTTDLSEPVSSNPSATVYSAPFAVASGTVVKFASSKTGLTVSQIMGAIAL